MVVGKGTPRLYLRVARWVHPSIVRRPRVAEYPQVCDALLKANTAVSAGGGAVNQVNIHLFVETMPFGDVGSAGMGHYYGKYGFDMLTHVKSMLISPPDVAIDHLFPSYSPEKDAELKLWFEY